MKSGCIPFLILILLGILSCYTIGQPVVNKSIRNQQQNYFSTDSVQKGKALFFNNELSKNNDLSCASCHYFINSDTLNWNPSLSDLAIKWRKKSHLDFEDMFFLPMTNKLVESHEDFDLNENELTLLKYYLSNVDPGGLMIDDKRTDYRRLSFFIGLAVFIMVLIDLIFFKLLRYKSIHLSLLVLCLFYCSRIVYADMLELGLQKGYEPDQPIKFSHKTHAGQNGTDCLYCHMPAKKSKSAGIPGVDLCLNCHAAVVEGEKSGGFEIAKLLEYKQDKKPIPWIRVNNLPDHVYFNHSSHVNGGMDCAECHGNIEEKDRIPQDQELSMKWCLDCHLERKVNLMDNEYYSGYKEYLENNNLPSDSVSLYQLGGWDCMNCHF